MAFRMSDFPSPDKMSLLDNVQIDVYTWRWRLKPSLECEIEKAFLSPKQRFLKSECGLFSKMESTLFVPAKLTFSENLRCLNLLLMVDAVSQKRLLSWTFFVFAGHSIHSGKFKHLKNSENFNFAGTNNVDSILSSLTVF